MAGCLCPAVSLHVPVSGVCCPPAGVGLVGQGSKPTAEDGVGVLTLLQLLKGRQRAEQGLLWVRGKGLRCLPAVRAAPLRYKYRRSNKSGVICCLQITTVMRYQRVQRIKLTIIVVRAVRRMWQWRIRVSERGVTGQGMKSLSFNWLTLCFIALAGAGRSL